jgi:hypothetical protein
VLRGEQADELETGALQSDAAAHLRVKRRSCGVVCDQADSATQQTGRGENLVNAEQDLGHLK